MSNNNNNSDRIYIILGVLGFLLVMLSCAALLIRHITKSDTGKKSPSSSSSSSPSPSPSPAEVKNNEPMVDTSSSHLIGCNTFRIKSRYGYYLKDMGDGTLRADTRILGGETTGWTIEGTFPDDFKLKGPNGYYLKDMGDAAVRLDSRSNIPGISGWSTKGSLNNLNIKGSTGRYLAMKDNGDIYFHTGQIPDANAWKMEC